MAAAVSIESEWAFWNGLKSRGSVDWTREGGTATVKCAAAGTRAAAGRCAEGGTRAVAGIRPSAGRYAENVDVELVLAAES